MFNDILIFLSSLQYTHLAEKFAVYGCPHSKVSNCLHLTELCEKIQHYILHNAITYNCRPSVRHCANPVVKKCMLLFVRWPTDVLLI